MLGSKEHNTFHLLSNSLVHFESNDYHYRVPAFPHSLEQGTIFFAQSVVQLGHVAWEGSASLADILQILSVDDCCQCDKFGIKITFEHCDESQ